jgi:hypothetical protein
MEVPQGNSCVSIYLKQAKMSTFFFYKIRDQEAEQVLPGQGDTTGRERKWGKDIGE